MSDSERAELIELWREIILPDADTTWRERMEELGDRGYVPTGTGSKDGEHGTIVVKDYKRFRQS